MRRHRFGVAAAASAVVLLIGFAAAMGVQARRIARERDRANQQAEAERRVAEFMKGMFKLSDPSEARGNSITAREILDNASKEIDTGLAKDPETQAQLIDVMGDVYESLDLYPLAQPLLERAVEIQRRKLGPRNPETLRSLDALAWLSYDEGQHAESEKLERETLDIRRQVLGREDPDTLTSMRHLAAILLHEGRYAEAERMQRETLDIQRRVLGPEHLDTLKTINNLGNTLQNAGRYAEAEKLYREALGIERRVLGREHPDTAITVYNLGCLAALQGSRNQALALLRETVEHGAPPFTELGIDQDPDLKSLHGDPRFAALVADAKERVAADQKPR